MDNRVENLVNAVGRLRDFSHTQDDLKNVRSILNRIFGSNAECRNFVFTNNTDKLPFGVIVMPLFDAAEINNFMIAGEDVAVKKYEVELDSKMFDYGLTDEEICQIILYNIYHLVKDFTPCQKVREVIDDYFVSSGKNLIIRDSLQYQAILALGCIDALVKVSSCFYLPDDVESDPFLESLDMGNFKNTLNKIYQKMPGCEVEATRLPKLSMLEWCLRLYDSVETERIPALHLLDKVKSISASSLYINRFNAVINALNRIDTDLYVNESMQMALDESKRHGGLLASLKYNGLRDIENDLYEFQIRARNAESESEVMYALKQINARLAILDDYIRENPDDPDIDRWIALKMQYIEVREVLAKKKLHKRSYGIFVDYNALDNEEE